MTLFDIIEAAEPVASPVKQEKRRLHAANLRVLAFLQERGARGATNWELSQAPFGISGTRRVRELRAWGYEIERVHVEGGTWNYIYKGVRPI